MGMKHVCFSLNWQKLDKKLLERIQMPAKYLQSFITEGIDKMI